MALGLTFDALPVYMYSNRRQFLPNESHMDRIFDEDVLIIMRKGILRFCEDGVPVELHPGEYYIQRAGLHQTSPQKSDSPNYFFVHFHGEFSEKGKLPLRGTFKMETIQPIIDQFLLLGNDASKLEYYQLFYNLLFSLARQQANENLAERIKTYLLQNYKNDITLKTLCDHFFLTANQIIYVFKTAYGKTPHRYLLDYRLDKAADLLTSTLRPIGDISQYVGFENYPVFYSDFVEKYKVTPSEYRKIKQAKFFMPPPNERPNNRKL